MPVHATTLPGGGHGYQWGKHGHKYASKANAAAQGRAAYANGYTGDDPHAAIGQAISELFNPQHKGAGVMFVAPDGHVLFLKRSEDSTQPGTWAWPGGTVEPGETSTETAKRETKEEIGHDFERDLTHVDHRDGYSTFGTSTTKKFNPLLNSEHSDFVWAHPERPPQPLHPGVAATLADKKAMGAWKGLYGNSESILTGDGSLAQDKSAREIDQDGHLYVKGSVLTKAVVNPYKGSEIPDYQALGLKADQIYHLWRHPEELKKGAKTLQGKPLLIDHKPITADDYPERMVAGSIANPTYADGEITGDLVIWRQDAIDEVKDGSKKELSCGYRYTPEMVKGTTPDGQSYDGVMRDILFNHVALVSEGRVNGAMVADSGAELAWDALGEAIDGLGFDAISSVLGVDRWEESAHPRGGNPKNAGQFSKGAGGGSAPQTRSSRRGGGTPRAELIRQAQSFGMSFHRASHKRRAVLEEVVARLKGERADKKAAAEFSAAWPAPKAAPAPAPAVQQQPEQRPSTQSRASKKELLKSLLEKTGDNPMRKLREAGFNPSRNSVYYMSGTELQKALEHLEKKGKKEAPAAPKAPELTPIQKTVRDAFANKTTNLKGEDFRSFVSPMNQNDARGKNRLAALFNASIKIKPKDFTKVMTNGLDPEHVHLGAGLNGELQLTAKFNGWGKLTRRFNFDDKSVDHSFLQLPNSAQGGGTAKKLLASQIETYKQLGLEKVTIHANIDVGGYAWAKYGYVPNQDSWNALRRQLKEKLTYNPGLRELPDATKNRIKVFLDSSNPKAIWGLSDLPDKMTFGAYNGKSAAKELMLNSDWYAELPLKNEDAMKRFNNYVNK